MTGGKTWGLAYGVWPSSEITKADALLGRHGSASLCRDERENKMAATYNVLAFKR